MTGGCGGTSRSHQSNRWRSGEGTSFCSSCKWEHEYPALQADKESRTSSEQRQAAANLPEDLLEEQLARAMLPCPSQVQQGSLRQHECPIFMAQPQ